MFGLRINLTIHRDIGTTNDLEVDTGRKTKKQSLIVAKIVCVIKYNKQSLICIKIKNNRLRISREIKLFF